MQADFVDYRAKGSYQNLGEFGEFSGRFRFIENGLAVGLLKDEGTDIPSHDHGQRLCFGLKNGDELAFWKLHELESEFMNLVYSMKDVGNGNYEGKWAGIGGVTTGLMIEGFTDTQRDHYFHPLSRLTDAIDAEGNDAKIAALSLLNKDAVESWLIESMVDDVYRQGTDFGRLELQKF